MSTSANPQALKNYIHTAIAKEHTELGSEGVNKILEAGIKFNSSQTLRDRGSIIFPHAGLRASGHQIAAAVHSCLDSGAKRVLAVGVLHALTPELQEARVRVANGADPTKEKFWGIQGPGFNSREEWKDEFSMLDFQFLWQVECQRRAITGPELVIRYPYLAGGKPEKLPGIAELHEIAQDKETVVVSTADMFHHGIGYGDPKEAALFPENGGLGLARKRIEEGLKILERGDYWGYNQHCVLAKSDGRDAGQVVRYLLGSLQGKIIDLTYADTTDMYKAAAPTWVAAALVELKSVKSA